MTASAIEEIFKKGQRVRLNARGTQFYKGSKRTRLTDWKARLGTVGHITRDRKRASVLWENNIALSEPLPLTFLEALDGSK